MTTLTKSLIAAAGILVVLSGAYTVGANRGPSRSESPVGQPSSPPTALYVADGPKASIAPAPTQVLYYVVFSEGKVVLGKPVIRTLDKMTAEISCTGGAFEYALKLVPTVNKDGTITTDATLKANPRPSKPDQISPSMAFKTVTKPDQLVRAVFDPKAPLAVTILKGKRNPKPGETLVTIKVVLPATD